jgi:3-hydroxyacyl-[acyl-carrier-protein] dehydratase
MNRLMQEIRQCMCGLTGSDDGGFTARFAFPPSFVGFQGHFPDKPVLAGTCEIQAVVVMFQEWKNIRVRIKEITLAKFFTLVSSDEEVIFECRERADGNDSAMVTALVTSHGEKVAELRIKVSLENERQSSDGGQT